MSVGGGNGTSIGERCCCKGLEGDAAAAYFGRGTTGEEKLRAGCDSFVGGWRGYGEVRTRRSCCWESALGGEGDGDNEAGGGGGEHDT